MSYIKKEDIGLTDFEIYSCNGDYKEALKLLLNKIEDMPIADVREVKRGKWIPPKFPYPWYHAHCSNCGYEDPFSHGGCAEWNGAEWKAMNFCPNCGADMRETNNKKDDVQEYLNRWGVAP